MTDSLHRCGRCLKDQLYQDYHDQDRGTPIHDDRKHREYLLLETFQAGLSRYTILKKREAFRKAFDNFDTLTIARYGQAKVDNLMKNTDIVRSEPKIRAAITNAQVFLDIQKECGSWDAWIWSWTNGKVINNDVTNYRDCLALSDLSTHIATYLKKRGMKYIGPTVMYAHLQATGQINDHENTCRKK